MVKSVTNKKRVSIEHKMVKAFKQRDAKKLRKLYDKHDKLTGRSKPAKPPRAKRYG